MADGLNLSEATLRRLAADISRYPEFGVERARRGIRRLAEHFEVWIVPSLNRAMAQERIEDAARFTGFCHHQIRRGRSATEFARSIHQGPNDEVWKVHAVFVSPLASKISRAILWVDSRTDTAGARVRLLSFPSRFTHALWLVDDVGHRLVLVDKPRPRQGPGYRMIYSFEEFLTLLERCPIAPRLVEPTEQ